LIKKKSNVLFAKDNFESYQDLNAPSYADLATSVVIYDATFSGYNSIALGTFGKVVLVYTPTQIAFTNSQTSGSKHLEDLPADLFNDMESFTMQQSQNDDEDVTQTQTPTLTLTAVGPSIGVKQKYQFNYELKREFFFKHSILGLAACDLSMNGGALDLVVVTLNGISVWRYEPSRVCDLLNKLFEKREQLFLSKYSSATSN
jgi:hypothetical protein